MYELSQWLIVTDIGGNRLSFGRATGRRLPTGISALILGIGFIIIGFTERKQGLHDLIANTYVIYSVSSHDYGRTY